MQSLYRSLTRRQSLNIAKTSQFRSTSACLASSCGDSHGLAFTRLDSSVSSEIPTSRTGFLRCFHRFASPSTATVGLENGCSINVSKWSTLPSHISTRSMTTVSDENPEEPGMDVPPRIKFKRPDKTARHIMQILDKEAVEEVKSQREIPDIRPGYIVQLKVVVPENKRRASIVKGIVIARRNAGLNTTFRLRRQVAGVGVESLYPLYSPNIKEIKVLDKKKVRRAKLYYLRDKMNALKK